MEKPKDKFWTITKLDVGTSWGNPNYIEWADKRIAALEAEVEKFTSHNSAMDAIAVLKRIKFCLDAVRLSNAEHEIYDIVCSALQQHQ